MNGARRAFGLFLTAGVLPAGVGRASGRDGTVASDIDLDAPAEAKVVTVWSPGPPSDVVQTIRKPTFGGNDTSFTLSREPASGVLSLDTAWVGPMRAQTLFRAEFSLRGTGWVPADPADVRIVLRRGSRGTTFDEGNTV